MMKALLALLACATMFSGAFAQNLSQAAKSTEIMEKLEKLELMNQILPLLLTKEQLRKLLPPIEKSRENVRRAQEKEFAQLKALEPTLDASLKDAHEKGEVPKREAISEAKKTIATLFTARQVIAATNTQAVLDVFNAVANSGQKKAAIGSVGKEFFPAGTKIEDVPDETRLKLFVQEILLHPLAYEVMRKLSI